MANMVPKVDVGDFVINAIKPTSKQASGGSAVISATATIQNSTSAPVVILTVVTTLETIVAPERSFVLQSTNDQSIDTWVVTP